MKLESKQILKTSIFLICALLSVRAINVLPYYPTSIKLILEVAAGPLSIILMYKFKYWLRFVIAILAFAGLIGLSSIGNSFGRFYFYGEELFYSYKLYISHGMLSILFIVLFIIWYYVVGRKENEEGF